MVTSCSWAPTLAMTLCLFTSESLATITNYIEVDGFVYATIGNAEVHSTGRMGCDDNFLDMPERWELVPWSDHEKVRDDVVSKYSFSTACVILGNGGFICGTYHGSQWDKPWVDENANYLQQDGNRYRSTACFARVLVRQEATTTTTATTTTSTISTTTQTATSSTTSTTTQTTMVTTRTTTKLRKNVAIASKSLRAVLGWSAVLAPVMFWAWAA